MLKGSPGLHEASDVATMPVVLLCSVFVHLKKKQKGGMLVTQEDQANTKLQLSTWRSNVHVREEETFQWGSGFVTRSRSINFLVLKLVTFFCSSALLPLDNTLGDKHTTKTLQRPVRKFYSSVLAEILPLSGSFRSFAQTLSLKGWNQLTSVSCDFSFRVIMSSNCTDILSKPLTGLNDIRVCCFQLTASFMCNKLKTFETWKKKLSAIHHHNQCK